MSNINSVNYNALYDILKDSQDIPYDEITFLVVLKNRLKINIYDSLTVYKKLFNCSIITETIDNNSLTKVKINKYTLTLIKNGNDILFIFNNSFEKLKMKKLINIL